MGYLRAGPPCDHRLDGPLHVGCGSGGTLCVTLVEESSSNAVPAELEDVAAGRSATAMRSSNTAEIRCTSSSAPAFPCTASRSASAVKPEMSMETSVPSIALARGASGSCSTRAPAAEVGRQHRRLPARPRPVLLVAHHNIMRSKSEIALCQSWRDLCQIAGMGDDHWGACGHPKRCLRAAVRPFTVLLVCAVFGALRAVRHLHRHQPAGHRPRRPPLRLHAARTVLNATEHHCG